MRDQIIERIKKFREGLIKLSKEADDIIYDAIYEFGNSKGNEVVTKFIFYNDKEFVAHLKDSECYVEYKDGDNTVKELLEDLPIDIKIMMVISIEGKILGFWR